MHNQERLFIKRLNCRRRLIQSELTNKTTTIGLKILVLNKRPAATVSKHKCEAKEKYFISKESRKFANLIERNRYKRLSNRGSKNIKKGL